MASSPRTGRSSLAAYTDALAGGGASEVSEPEPGEELWVKFRGDKVGMRIAQIDRVPAEVTFDFHPRATLELQIENPEDLLDEYRVSVRIVSAEWRDWNSRFRPSSYSSFSVNASGKVTMDWEATDVRVLLSGSHQRDGVHYHGPLGTYEYRLEPGLNRKTVRFEGLYELVFQCATGVKSNQIQLTRDGRAPDAHPLHPMKHDESSATFWVPPGRYRATHHEQGRMRVDVAGNATVEFRGVPADRLRLSRVREHGYLARCGLRDGDEIIRFDGETRTGREPLRGAERQIAYGDALVLEVLRGGATLEIQLDPDLLETAGQPGARLRQAYPPE